MPDIRELIVRLSGDNAGLSRTLAETEGELKTTGSKFDGFGKVVAGAFLATGVVAAVAGAASIKMAASFQEGMTTLITGAGESEKNIKQVSAGILDLARSTGTTTKQLTDGMFMIESAGFHGKAGLDVLKSSAEGAKVGNADLGTVADATTTILKDFGNTGITSAGAVNTLIATVANGKTHMEDLSKALSQILPTASAAHIGLNDVMGAMATMTGEGVPAANAATYLRQTIIALEAPSSAAKTALQNVGLSSADVAKEMQTSLPDALKMVTDAVGKKFPEGSAQYVEAIKAISGGSKTMQGMLDLTGQHLKDFQANTKTVGDTVKAAGDRIEGWNKVQGDFNFKMSQAKEIIATAGITIGTTLLPVVTNIANKFINLVGSLNSTNGTLANFGEQAKIVGDKVRNFLAPSFDALWNTITSKLMPALLNFWHNIIEPLIPILGGVLVGSLKLVIDALNILFQIITPVINFMADHKQIVFDLAGAFVVLRGAMMLQDAFGALKVGFATLQLIQIPGAIASVESLYATIGAGAVMGSIVIAGALADIALVGQAVNEVIGAIKTMNNMAAGIAADNASISAGEKQIMDLEKNGTPAQQARAKQAMATLAGRASGGPVSAGTPYVVGEGGQEIFIPNQPGRIVNAKDTQKVMNNGSGGNVNVTVNVGMYAGMPVEKRQIALELYKELVRAARAQGVQMQMIGAMSPQ